MNKLVSLHNENSYGISYQMFYPDKYEDNPLIVFLHGAGERGTDISHVDRWALPRLLKSGLKIPAVILCPQCPVEYTWDNIVKELKALIDEVVEKFQIKKDRILITGASMGGFGTWSMGINYPTFFAGIAPVAGGGMSWRASNLISTPVYAVHGEKDGTVPVIYSQLMVDGVKACGGKVEFISLAGMDHGDGIEYAYEHTQLIEWLLKQRRKDFSAVAEACSEYF
ncbi:MAG: phospholipase [Lachnospiraceae bacterium]|nr:phospholipase [Lachnospiraceae bacterium]